MIYDHKSGATNCYTNIIQISFPFYCQRKMRDFMNIFSIHWNMGNSLQQAIWRTVTLEYIWGYTITMFVFQNNFFLQALRDIGISHLVFLFSNICDFYRLSLREASQKSLTLWKHSQNITALTFLIGAEGTYTFLWPWYATPGPLYSRHRKTQFHLRCPPLTDPLPFCRHHYSDNIICTHILSRCVAIQNFKSFKMDKIYSLKKTNIFSSIFR